MSLSSCGSARYPAIKLLPPGSNLVTIHFALGSLALDPPSKSPDRCPQDRCAHSPMSLFFWIVVGAALGALLLGLFLKVRLKDQQVWEEMVETKLLAPSPESESSRNPAEADRPVTNAVQIKQTQDFQGEDMNNPSLPSSNPSVHEPELRRSSRVERPVSLVVLGTNRRGEIFQERTSAVCINLHGCRYSSRHEYAPEGWVTLQVTGTDGANSRPVRARVRSVFSPQTSRELCQVGVELETPGNIWGIPAPPEDWQRVLTVNSFASRAATAAAPAPASHSAPSLSSFLDRNANLTERRAEVTVFPGPQTQATSVEEASEKEIPTDRTEKAVPTAEQFLQTLQGKLQLIAERAVEASLASQLDDAVKAALGKIEDGWHANLRQAEEFSAKHLAETQSLWEKELNIYRDRAEEISHRMESLSALSQQAISESQKAAERFQGETVPQLHSFFNESFQHANSEFEAHAAEVSARQLAELTEDTKRAINAAHIQLDEIIARANSFAALPNVAASESVMPAQLDARLDSLRAENVDRIEKRLSEHHSAVQQLLDARLDALQTETFERLEKRLNDIHSSVAQQLESVRNHGNDLAHHLEGLALESRQSRSQQDQNAAEIRSLVAGIKPGVPQEQLDSILNASREQMLSHLEWRLGEVCGHFDQLFGQVNNRANDLGQQLEKLAADARRFAEHASRGLSPQDLDIIEQAVGRASREFENAAARVSDRHLIRLMEQKQVVTQEASLELEARASEARALLQKASNNSLDEFRRRADSQIDQALAEAKERVVSSLASLDAESRAAVEARRRSLENEVARAAEQSTMEFRSGIKAFLYSCLVAAVSAVDQHAQTTLVGLSNDPNNLQRALEAATTPAIPSDTTQLPPKAAASSE